jgi:hypothetical protein
MPKSKNFTRDGVLADTSPVFWQHGFGGDGGQSIRLVVSDPATKSSQDGHSELREPEAMENFMLLVRQIGKG